MQICVHASGPLRLCVLLCAFPLERWKVRLKYVYIYFHDCDHSLSFLCPFFLLSLCVSSFHLYDLLSIVPLFSFSPLHYLIPLNENLILCCLSLSLSPPLCFCALFFFPPSPPHPPSCLLQVVKWILLSQSHQGKSRKRKRIEPKVNYKVVGDSLVYYDFYLHCRCSHLNSWKCPFLF